MVEPIKHASVEDWYDYHIDVLLEQLETRQISHYVFADNVRALTIHKHRHTQKGVTHEPTN